MCQIHCTSDGRWQEPGYMLYNMQASENGAAAGRADERLLKPVLKDCQGLVTLKRFPARRHSFRRYSQR